MKYFRLKADTFLINGANESVLYDVSFQRAFVVCKKAADYLKELEKNRIIEPTIQKTNWKNRLISQICEMGLGYFENAPAYIEKTTINSPLRELMPGNYPPSYFRAYWNISNDCEWNCNFCGGKSDILTWRTCITCIRSAPGTSIQMDSGKVIEQISKLGVSLIVIRGGNPFLKWQYLNSIIEEAQRYPHLTIQITTPGIGHISRRVIDITKKFKILFNVIMPIQSRRYNSSQIPINIMNDQQINLIDELRKNKIMFYLTFLLSDITLSLRETLIKFSARRWKLNPGFSYAIESDNVDAYLNFREQYPYPLSYWKSREEFYFRMGNKLCLSGTFEISSDGMINPCPGFNVPCGKILNSNISSALTDPQLYTYWKSDSVYSCRCTDCSTRYLCLTCWSTENKMFPVLNGRRECPFRVQLFKDALKMAHKASYVFSPLEIEQGKL